MEIPVQEKQGHIYILSSKNDKSMYKIGKHSGDYNELSGRYGTYIPNMDIHLLLPCKDYTKVENEVKKHLDNKRVLNDNGNKSEWIRVSLEEIIGVVMLKLSENGDISLITTQFNNNIHKQIPKIKIDKSKLKKIEKEEAWRLDFRKTNIRSRFSNKFNYPLLNTRKWLSELIIPDNIIYESTNLHKEPINIIIDIFEHFKEEYKSLVNWWLYDVKSEQDNLEQYAGDEALRLCHMLKKGVEDIDEEDMSLWDKITYEDIRDGLIPNTSLNSLLNLMEYRDKLNNGLSFDDFCKTTVVDESIMEKYKEYRDKLWSRYHKSESVYDYIASRFIKLVITPLSRK